MTNYITGKTIKELREKQGLTQRQLADILQITDKTVSKWETGRGLPDISLLDSIAKALKVSMAELFSGEFITNSNKCGNMQRGGFYVCPICGNIIFAVGEGSYSCCGINLPMLEAEEDDGSHLVTRERIDDEEYISIDHPMTKEHFISFLAYVSGDKAIISKLYPEQSPETMISFRGHGWIYAYCNKHGLFRKRV